MRLFVFFLIHFKVTVALVCYSCTSTLSSAVDEAGQLALRVFLDATYQLPAVHRLCNMEDDIDFKTLPTAQCSYKDNCVKISASNQGINFVIRGCESLVYRSRVAVQDLPCSSNSPSICKCHETLCNSMPKPAIAIFVLVLSLILPVFVVQ